MAYRPPAVVSVEWVPVSAIAPLFITMMMSAWRMVDSRCATVMAVMAVFARFWLMVASVRVSRALVA